MTIILDGKSLADSIRQEVASDVFTMIDQKGVRPCLAAVLVGDDPASQVYIRNKERACEKSGIESQIFRLSRESTTDELLRLLDRLNADSGIHGILVQLPLPSPLDSRRILDGIDPRKDVDAFAPENVGLISQGRARFLPCTPHGVMQILWRSNIETQGKHVVIVGRSDIVGKPLAMLLSQKESPWGDAYANATVTCCHSRTPNLADYTRTADILIVAIGRPNAVDGTMVGPGAVVIDVGINRLENRLVGDVDFDSVKDRCSAITPVPGGVGPLTIAMLLVNTLKAANALHP